MMRKFKGISVCVAVIGGSDSAFAADPIHAEEIALLIMTDDVGFGV